MPTLEAIIVIASEAKQSSFVVKSRKLDCFVAFAPRNDVDRPYKAELILPDGQISKFLSSPFAKNILIFRRPKSDV